MLANIRMQQRFQLQTHDSVQAGLFALALARFTPGKVDSSSRTQRTLAPTNRQRGCLNRSLELHPAYKMERALFPSPCNPLSLSPSSALYLHFNSPALPLKPRLHLHRKSPSVASRHNQASTPT